MSFVGFTGLSDDEVHMYNRTTDECFLIDYSIIQFFKGKEYENYEDLVLNMFIEAEDKNNPFAWNIIADWYKNGTYLEKSEELYINCLCNTLKETSDLIRIVKDMWEYQEFETNDTNELVGTGLLFEVCLKLAKYYESSSDITELANAEYYYQIANWCGGYQNSTYNKEIQSIKKRIENIKYLRENKTIDNSSEIMRSEVLSVCLRDYDTISSESFTNVITKLKQEFDNKNWEKLTSESKSYLITALYTFSSFVSVGEQNYKYVDFSPCISLLTRSLEYELKLRFQDGYLLFLQTEYPSISSYCSANKIPMDRLTIERKTLFERKRSDTVYLNTRMHSNMFTLGSLSFTIGYNFNERKIGFDQTAIEYCKKKLIQKGWNDEKIKTWLQSLCNNVELLRTKRNTSSHGGKVLTQLDAEYVFDQMIFTKRILENLMHDCIVPQ